jgi:hypothetical protein
MRSYDVKYITQLYSFLINLSSGNINKINLPFVQAQLCVSQTQAIENHKYLFNKIKEIEERLKILEKK